MAWHATIDPYAAAASLEDPTGAFVIEIDEGPGCDLPAAMSWLAGRHRLPVDRLTVRDEAFVTIEGEPVVFIEGRVDGHAVVAAFVDADILSARIHARTDAGAAAACRDSVRLLARSTTFGLGFPRRRRFRYRGPEGWERRPLGLFTELRPPRGDAVLSIAPALPKTVAGAPLLDKLRLEEGSRAIEDVVTLERRVFTNESRLSGPLLVQRARLAGELQVRATASLEDDVFLYCVRLDARLSAADVAVRHFVDVLRSIKPCPRRPMCAESEVASQWRD